jgi:predicted dehydrogenase
MTLSVAFVGAGPAAQPYLEALARRPEVKLTAICDADRRAAEQIAAGWQARVFPDSQSLLQECPPEALWICVPPQLQGNVIAQAIAGKIPFFIEPPGAVDFAQAASFAAAVKANRLVSAVGFTARYADVLKDARDYLGGNTVPIVQGWWLGQPEEDPAPERLLWMDACRFVDVMRFFCGDAKRVRALRAGPADAAAAYVLQIEFASGSIGLMTCASFARAEPRYELELAGEGWTLTFGEKLASLRLAERDRITILRGLNNPVEAQVEAFLKAVAGQDPGLVAASYPDSLGTLAICHAAAVSVREARPVDLPE